MIPVKYIPLYIRLWKSTIHFICIWYGETHEISACTCIFQTFFFFQAVEAETAHVIEKMTSDLQIYCRNKPLLQSTPHIGKVNIVLTQISVNQEFYRELLPLQ